MKKKKDKKFKIGDLVVIKYYNYYDLVGLVVDIDDNPNISLCCKVCIQTYGGCVWFQEDEIVLAY